MLKRLVRAHGRAAAFVEDSANRDEVAAILDRTPEVDVILLDLTMPGVRGFSGLMYLRAQYPSVPVVIVSANDEPAVIRRCMDFGASGFIPKTLGVEAMRAAIATVLRGGVWTPPDVDLTAAADADSDTDVGSGADVSPDPDAGEDSCTGPAVFAIGLQTAHAPSVIWMTRGVIGRRLEADQIEHVDRRIARQRLEGARG